MVDFAAKVAPSRLITRQACDYMLSGAKTREFHLGTGLAYVINCCKGKHCSTVVGVAVVSRIIMFARLWNK